LEEQIGRKMNVAIFGLGYVGCVSLGCLARTGHRCIGVDLNETKVNYINCGKASVAEGEIETIIRQYRKQGNISATSDSLYAVRHSDISIICVGTPSTNNGHLDLSAIFKVAEEIGNGLKDNDRFHVVVIRSTVLPGTNHKVKEIIQNVSGKAAESHFAVVSNPEFLREGCAVKDFYCPPYTLVGTTNTRAIAMLQQLYRDIDAPFIVTDVKIAELVKYVNNAFHACKIIFSNEIGNICKKMGVDSHKLMEIFCLDKKLNISPYYLKPGFAYGGSCLPKDLKALKTIAHDHYLECPVLETIERSNEVQKKVVLEQVIEFGKEKIGFLGLSFKSGTDDLRNSPILDVIEILLGKGFDVRIYDKNVHFSRLMGANKEYILKKIPLVSKFLVKDLDALIDHSEVIVVVNREKEFEAVLNRLPPERLIYDLVNIDFERKNRMKNYVGLAW
jgi:GDP-mannose 6-dehydrogenase